MEGLYQFISQHSHPEDHLSWCFLYLRIQIESPLTRIQYECTRSGRAWQLHRLYLHSSHVNNYPRQSEPGPRRAGSKVGDLCSEWISVSDDPVFVCRGRVTDLEKFPVRVSKDEAPAYCNREDLGSSWTLFTTKPSAFREYVLVNQPQTCLYKFYQAGRLSNFDKYWV